ncbi:MAG: polysaccharide biosynthesis/export family protein [Verrucomicrobiota bacterium]
MGGSLLAAAPEDLPLFGEQLFDSEVAQQSYNAFNPDYRVSIGDRIRVQLWGGFNVADVFTVDAQGNIFLPEVGPVTVAGVPNSELNQVITDQVKTVYKENVEVYANLEANQDIKVFVSGFVARPGVYSGKSFDSLIYFLDQAGGIDPLRGSFLEVSVRRGGEERFRVNLYDFLLGGDLQLRQLADGDTIFVPPQQKIVAVLGNVRNAYRYEFAGDGIPLAEVLAMASVVAGSTHVDVQRSQPNQRPIIYRSLDNMGDVRLYDGDYATVYDHTRPEQLTVRLTGEQEGPRFLILDENARVSDAVTAIEPTVRSNMDALQLYRRSVAVRQKQALEQSLDRLESTVLAARSATLEEARIRAEEAETILEFIKRAREVTFTGQVTLPDTADLSAIFLENGDELRVPPKTSVILVYGEVSFPNTQIYNPDHTVADYLADAGGLSPNADNDQVFLQKVNGEILRVKRLNSRRYTIEPGDEIFVLPEVPSKNLQLAKEISAIIYQLALGARVVIAL